MNRSNFINFNFSTIDNLNNKRGLHVNITLTSKYTASEWYPYQKKMTIVRNSELMMHSLNERNILFSSIEVFNPEESLYYEKTSDNIYANIGVDIHKNFTFGSEYYDLSIDIEGSEDPIVSRAVYSKNMKLSSIAYYEPNEAEYKIYPLSEDMIYDISESYSYEELKNSEKLLEVDILQLDNLTINQMKDLVLIHEEKSFKLLSG